MFNRAQQLAARRSRLRTQCAIQRRHLGEVTGAIESQLGRVDQVVNSVRGLITHPAAITGALALLVLIGPRRVLRWTTQGAFYYSAAKRMMGLIRSQ